LVQRSIAAEAAPTGSLTFHCRSEFIRDWFLRLSRLKPLLQADSPSDAGANSFTIGSDVYQG
jgi:hypothetical protein